MNGFDISTISNCYIGGTQASAIYIGNDKLWPTTHDYSLDYFTIESLEDNNDIQFYMRSSSAPSITIQWSTDGTNWNSYTSSTSSTAFTTLNTGDKIMIKSTTNQYANGDNGNNSSRLASTKTINVYGNIMSLLYGDNFVGQTTLTAKYTFRSLFYQGKIVDASNLILPATTLTEVCYFAMFNECTTLTAAPKVLPALTVTNRCYLNMFCDCTSLASVEYNMLPATTLAPECYKGFLARTKITIAPLLPATTLRNYCYQWMYNGCSRLNNITCLATNISAYSCVDAWVIGVANSGTFYKAPSMTSWPRSTSGIPSNWTVVDA